MASIEHSELLAAQRLEDLFHPIPVACFTHDREGTIRDWSAASAELLGYGAPDALGRSIYELIYPREARGRIQDVVAGVFGGRTHHWTEEELALGPNAPRWVFCGVFAVRGARGEIVGAMHTMLDISARKRSEEAAFAQVRRLEAANAALQALATTDGLTGLVNHRHFHERLTAELRRALHGGPPTSLVLLDVDHFKRFNDTYGHRAGDETLREVGATLRAAVRPGDCAARYGGEEFAVILPATVAAEASIVARRLRETIRDQRWQYAQVTVSLGVATSDESLLNCEDLVERADRALYASKSAGRDRVTDWSSLGERPTASIGNEEWGRRIDEARRDSTGSAAIAMLQQAIFDHLQWKNRLHRALEGSIPMGPTELATHRECRLGRWYFSAGEACFGDLAEFRALDAPHARLHALAGSIHAAICEGRPSSFTPALEELEACSTSILCSLDRLIARAERSAP